MQTHLGDQRGVSGRLEGQFGPVYFGSVRFSSVQFRSVQFSSVQSICIGREHFHPLPVCLDMLSDCFLPPPPQFVSVMLSVCFLCELPANQEIIKYRKQWLVRRKLEQHPNAGSDSIVWNTIGAADSPSREGSRRGRWLNYDAKQPIKK